MKRSAFSYLALAALLFCTILNCSCGPSISTSKLSPVNTAKLQQALEKWPSESEIQTEVDKLLTRFGGKNSEPIYGAILSTTPGLARFAKALSDDPLLDIVPSGDRDISVPRHVEIRFGAHFHYQFILIFQTGTDLSTIKPPLEKVTNNIYFEP